MLAIQQTATNMQKGGGWYKLICKQTVMMSHRLWSRKLLELRQCLCHRAWRYFHWKQCRITFSTVNSIKRTLMWSGERCAFIHGCRNSERLRIDTNRIQHVLPTCSCFMFLQQEMSNLRLKAINNSKITLDRMKHNDSVRVRGIVLYLASMSTYILGMPPALVRLILNLNRDNVATALQFLQFNKSDSIVPRHSLEK